MREFKIRVWDVKNKDWYYTVPGKPEDHNVLDTYYFENLYQNEEDYIWEQYTGLKDKNGKEIYEGDIVKATVRISTPYKGDTFRNIRGNVIYGPGGAFCIEEPEVFTSNDEGSKREFTVINPLFNVGSKAGVEVIGNIHEGKESDGKKEN